MLAKATAAALACTVITAAAVPANAGDGRSEAGGAMPAAPRVVDAALVAQLTGADSINDTAVRWGVHGADLGHMFWHRERLYMVFGDTFGEGGLGGANWRSNTMAVIANPAPADGLRIERMIAGDDGLARELISSLKLAGVEKTVIPTYGISVGGRIYLHYMSVRRWGAPGYWDVRHSGFAYSDDDGETWRVSHSARWPGGSGFEQVALVPQADHVHSLGIPGGRWGEVRLRRVAPERMLDPAAYEYWDGGIWVADPRAAATVVPGPVGELSVIWSDYFQRWLMMYFNPRRNAVVLRAAANLTGPWTGERVVVTGDDYPGLYAPYMVPVAGAGDQVYFTMSLWDRYNVVLMRATLSAAPDAAS